MSEHDYPTKDAYMCACRALHWREAQLRSLGAEPIQIAHDAPQYPPDDAFSTEAEAKNVSARIDHGTASQAIEWAVHVNRDAQEWEFLNAWQQGKLDEWPEYYEWLEAQPRLTPAADAGDREAQPGAVRERREALQEAIDVFEGMCDDEIEEELLPRLRAALAATAAPLAVVNAICEDIMQSIPTYLHKSIYKELECFADAILEEAAKVAETMSSICVEKRDNQLHFGNNFGALVNARQAQTSDEIATAIRAQKIRKE